MSNRIALIVPHFGQFNNYYEFWLRSCQANSDKVDFIIFTDDNRVLTKFKQEGNLKLFHSSLAEVRRLAETKLETNVVLEHPYKLCDLKAMYGIVFEDYLRDYDFWGYCDNDLVFGKIDDFVTDEMLVQYDKIFTRGHLTIMRNTAEVNNLFKQSERTGIVPSWRKVLASPQGFSFDEWAGVSRLWQMLANDRVCDDIVFDDINWTKKHFLSTQKQVYGTDQGKSHFIFEWNNGRLWRIYWDEHRREIKREPTLYVHFQKRHLSIATDDTDHYLIVPNRFIPYEAPTQQLIFTMGRRRLIYLKYFTERGKIWKRRLTCILNMSPMLRWHEKHIK